ncbi:Ger(x)C family spore germination protein [Clostridium thermarum]|uniref:Ger(x)C family spore germination protein n=1 Tax=Clostridium thermarum TaxID=1716543 RepID=UPI0013D01294|nr:Ger(x)C family spore germination protein [Clostridium thermarum]
MKMRLLSMVLAVVFLFTGCFNYRDINRVMFDLAVLIDIDENDNVVLYTETFKPFKGTAQGAEQGVRLINKIEGKTIFEAIRNLSLASGYKHNYTQNKALIFSERAARKGLKPVLDFIDRDQEFLIRPFVFVYLGDLQDLFKLQPKDEEYLGIYVDTLINTIGDASRAVIVNVNEFLNSRYLKSNTQVIPALRIKRDSLMDKIELDGGAVIQHDKMTDYIPRQQTQSYNFLRDRVKRGTLEVTNPDSPQGYITLEILGSKTKTKIKYDGKKIILIKIINVKTSLAESQYMFNMCEENISKLERSAEENIKKYTSQLFDEYSLKEIDIFEIGEELHRYYPKFNIDNPITITQLEVKAYVNIEGSSNKTDFY